MTDKEFAAAIKVLEGAMETVLKLSSFQLWAEDAQAIGEQLSSLIERMKER